MVKKFQSGPLSEPKVFEQRTAAFKNKREWKRRLRETIGFPDFGVDVWRPIMEEIGRTVITHKDPIYWEAHKFVSNAKASLAKKLQKDEAELAK